MRRSAGNMSAKVAIAKLDVVPALVIAVRPWFAHAKARRRGATGQNRAAFCRRRVTLAFAECPIDLVRHRLHKIG